MQLPQGNQSRIYTPWNHINPSLHGTKASSGGSSGRQGLEGTSTEQSRNQLQAGLGEPRAAATAAGLELYAAHTRKPLQKVLQVSPVQCFGNLASSFSLRNATLLKERVEEAVNGTIRTWGGPEQHSLTGMGTGLGTSPTLNLGSAPRDCSRGTTARGICY